MNCVTNYHMNNFGMQRRSARLVLALLKNDFLYVDLSRTL